MLRIRDVLTNGLQDALLNDLRDIVLDYCGSVITSERTIDDSKRSIWDICSGDNKRIASVSSNSVMLHDLATGTCITTLEGHYIQCVDMNRTGSLIASGSSEGVLIWDGMSYTTLHTCTFGDLINAIGFSPTDHSVLAVQVSRETVVRFLNAVTGKDIWSCLEAEYHIQSMCWSHDGEWMAAGTQSGSIIIWHVKTRKQLFKLEGHTECVTSVCFSPDRTRLVSGSADDTVSFSLVCVPCYVFTD